MSVVGFLIFIFISAYVYRVNTRKQLKNRQDFKILNVKLDEKTMNRKKTMFNTTIHTPLTLENNNKRFMEYIEELKQKNEVKCYEIVYDDEFTSYSQLKQVRKLGNGGFGQVWEVTNKQEQTFALKLFINAEKFTTDQDFENFTNMTKEFQTLNILNCPYIVYVCGIAYSFQNDKITLGIVEECMEMDLSKFLQEKRNDLTLDEKINFSINITNCILEIHHKNFIHHDIKLPNLLIARKGNDFEIKLTDFGTCLQADNDLAFLNGISFNYGAPENILHCCFEFPFENNPKSDIWSLGIVFYKIFVDDSNIIFPWSYYFKNKNKQEYDKRIKEQILGEKLKKNHYIDNHPNWELGALLNECLQVNLENRPTIDEILENLIHIKNNLKRFRLKLKSK